MPNPHQQPRLPARTPAAPPGPTPGRAERALPHTARLASALPACRTLALAAVLGAGLWACGGGAAGGPEAAPPGGAAGGAAGTGAEPGALPELDPTDEERAAVEALIEASLPPDPTATSDVQDAQLARRRALASELGTRVANGGAPGLARHALDLFEASGELPDATRAELLGLAARGFGPALAPRLKELIATYGPEFSLGLRTQAVRILAEAAPREALDFLAPLALEDRPSSTRPPQAALVDGWIEAARRLAAAGEEVDTRTLADVTTNLFQPPEARYAAIGGLGQLGGQLAVAALEEVLIEASSDGYVRRKAAQALVACSAPEVYCPLFGQVASHESDEPFLWFVIDMIERHCEGVEIETGHEGHDH